MKNQILYSLLFLALLFGCKEENSGSDSPSFSAVLPSSTGGVDEMMFVIPDNIYSTSTKESIRENFNGNYRILPKEEDMFTISKVPYSSMNSLMFRFRNIVLTANTSEESSVLATAKEVLTSAQFSALEAGEQKAFIVNNVWSKPQNVVFLFGNSPEDLQKTFESAGPEVQKYIQDSDRKEYGNIAFINGINGKLKEQWNEFHQIDFNIPTDYQLAENEGNFVSLRKDIDKGMIFIFFDVVYYEDKVPDFNNGIALRNERGPYVSTQSEGSYMSTDSTLGFLTSKTIENNIITYETSGLWTMENDFMGGPFINQYIIDQKNNRVIFLDGFIYAPGEFKKKRYMRQIEAIFATLEVN